MTEPQIFYPTSKGAKYRRKTHPAGQLPIHRYCQVVRCQTCGVIVNEETKNPSAALLSGQIPRYVVWGWCWGCWMNTMPGAMRVPPSTGPTLDSSEPSEAAISQSTRGKTG